MEVQQHVLPELSHGGRGFIKAAGHAADIQNRFHRRFALLVPSVRFKLLAFADRLGVGGRLGGGDAGQRRQGRLGLRHELSSAAVPAAVGASLLCSAPRQCHQHSDTCSCCFIAAVRLFQLRDASVRG